MKYYEPLRDYWQDQEEANCPERHEADYVEYRADRTSREIEWMFMIGILLGNVDKFLDEREEPVQ